MVPMNQIIVGNQKVNYNFDSWKKEGGKAFLDSGTTFVYFDNILFDQFTQSITKHC